MTLFTSCISSGLLLMAAGVTIALSSEDIPLILAGAALCWLSLPCFWAASKAMKKL